MPTPLTLQKKARVSSIHTKRIADSTIKDISLYQEQ